MRTLTKHLFSKYEFGFITICLHPKLFSHTELRKKTDAVTSTCGQAWIKHIFLLRIYLRVMHGVCVCVHASVCWGACIYLFLFCLKNRWFLVLNGSCVNSVGSWLVAAVQRQHGYRGGVLVEVQFAYFRCAVNRTEGSEVVRTVAPCSSCLSTAARATTGNNPLALLWVQTYVTV